MRRIEVLLTLELGLTVHGPSSAAASDYVAMAGNEPRIMLGQ